MPLVNLENLGLKGLNTDTPSQTLDPTEFADGIDLRPFDGSLQGVYDFGAIDNAVNGLTEGLPNPTRNMYAFTQWTRTGEQALTVGYMFDPDNTDINTTQDLTFQVVRDITGTGAMIAGAAAVTPIDENARFNIDMFAFNDLVVINDGQNLPVYLFTENGELYDAKILPSWPGSEVTSLSPNTKYAIFDVERNAAMELVIDLEDWQTLTDTPGLTEEQVLEGRVFTTSNAENAQDELNTLIADNPTLLDSLHTPVLAQRITQFNNRLIAINISEEYLGSADYGNSTILWSTPISALNNIDSVTFQPLSTNDAGDDILTETSGEVLDGASLGQYLIVYKSDSVYRVADVGGPLVLATELLFDDDGLYAPSCFADIGDGKHLVMGNYGVYLHDGGPNKENISRGRIERELYSAIPTEHRDRTFAFHHTADKEVWLCYASESLVPPMGSTEESTGCDKAFVFNYRTNSWYRRNLIPETVTTTLDGIRGITEAELNGELFLYGWGKLGPRRLGNERNDNGGDLRTEGNVEFRNMVLNDPVDTKGLTGVYPTGDASFEVGVNVSNHLAEVMEYKMRDYDPSSMYKLDYRLNGRYYHLKMAQIDNNNPKITNVGIDVKKRGKR